ncbi:transposase [Serratia fonticola]|nr:transposase [Serratia fonticola]
MASVNVHCPRCDSVLVYCHAQNPKDHSRLRCCECRSVFHLTYTYQARMLGLKEKIVDMAFNGAGVRDTARTLKVGINTVIRTLKTQAQAKTSSPVAHADVALICEFDE